MNNTEDTIQAVLKLIGLLQENPEHKVLVTMLEDLNGELVLSLDEEEVA